MSVLVLTAHLPEKYKLEILTTYFISRRNEISCGASNHEIPLKNCNRTVIFFQKEQ